MTNCLPWSQRLVGTVRLDHVSRFLPIFRRFNTHEKLRCKTKQEHGSEASSASASKPAEPLNRRLTFSPVIRKAAKKSALQATSMYWFFELCMKFSFVRDSA